MDAGAEKDRPKSEEEYIRLIEEECFELEGIIEEYNTKVSRLYNKNVKQAKYVQYGRGGSIFRGYYCPSPTHEIVIGNSSRGRLVKKLLEVNELLDENYISEFIYYFDDQDRLSAVAHPNNSKEVVWYKDNYSISLVCDKWKTIDHITKCTYDNNQIMSYSFGDYTQLSLDEEKRIMFFEKEVYGYKDNKLDSVHRFDYIRKSRLFDHLKYYLLRDEEGYVSKFFIERCHKDGNITRNAEPYKAHKRRKI